MADEKPEEQAKCDEIQIVKEPQPCTLTLCLDQKQMEGMATLLEMDGILSVEWSGKSTTDQVCVAIRYNPKVTNEERIRKALNA